MNDKISIVGEAITIFGFCLGAITLRRSIREDRETQLSNYVLLTHTVSEMKNKLDKETGGNSGGLREAVNIIRDTQVKEEGKLELIAILVHRLDGAFDEHRVAHERA